MDTIRGNAAEASADSQQWPAISRKEAKASADSQLRPAISEEAAEASAERQTIDHSAPCRKYICFTLSTYIVITIYFLGV